MADATPTESATEAGPFRPVGSELPFLEIEERLRAFWHERSIFQRSIEERPADRIYSFYEGPPTANGSPGVHHVLARAFKDLFPRYRTMQGDRVPRKGGWDTHGLPVELEVERELGLNSKAEIEQFGIAEFNARCRESVMRYVEQWEEMTERVAFWIDMEDAYRTYTADYIESCWYIFRTLWDNNLIYEARRTTPHCPRCETSLSSHEVAQGYEEDTPDPSVHIAFRAHRETLPGALRDFAGETYLLAWTTTPWTLPGNSGLAVAEDEQYIAVDLPDGSRLLLAAARLVHSFAGIADQPPQPEVTLSGADLVGLTYDGLYEPDAWGVPPYRFDGNRLERWDEDDPLPPRRVVAAGFVSMEEGTGIVHIAPAFGEDDYLLGRDQGLIFRQPVDLKGRITGERSPFHGQWVKDADENILADLKQRGLLFKRDVIRHTYPFCWRCGTALLYYAKPSWYIATSRFSDLLLRGNREVIEWHPEHLRDGRYGDWLANNVDWAISRERYWGTPLPIWRCRQCNSDDCIGSFAELADRAKAGQELDLSDPHRPYVDAIVIECPDCGGEMRRIPEVADAWFDSGAMPYAQWHYPFENEETFNARFPADFICEAVDQTRGWFYSLHAEAALLHASEAVPEPSSYRHVLSLGHILDEDGEKMSKSRGNVVDPFEVLDEHGADALRWYCYIASPAGNPRRFSSRLVGEAQRRFFFTLWNTYSFFVTYANIDGFQPDDEPAADLPDLDRWIRGALHQLIGQVTEALDAYDPVGAARALEEFVDQLSNWYVRRSRRRFWSAARGGELASDAEKAAAYSTLYECLTTLAKLLAPFTPYIAEEIYRNLVAERDGGAAESVHLASWPEADPSLADTSLLDEMDLIQRVASLGRAARSQAGIKVRQPLPSVTVGLRNTDDARAIRKHEATLLEELNVKSVEIAEAGGDVRRYVIKPNLRLLGPRLGGDLPSLRTALQSLDPAMAAQVAMAVEAGESVEVEEVTLAPDELLIESEESGEAAASQDARCSVTIDAEIDDALRREGLAREVIHTVQGRRRDSGLELADRIELWLTPADDELRAALQSFDSMITTEVLAVSLQEAEPPDNASVSRTEIEGHALAIGLRRAP